MHWLSKGYIYNRYMEKKISAEITRQLVLLKYQLDFEINKDKTQILSYIDQQLAELKDDINRRFTQLESSLDSKINSQLTVTEKNQLAVVEQTRELMTRDISRISTHMANRVYDKITDDINTKIAPKLENLVQYVAYNNQDTNELITRYRAAVTRDENTKMLSYKQDGQISDKISEYVKLAL